MAQQPHFFKVLPVFLKETEMGLFNQGWGCRCDECDSQADSTICGRTKAETRDLAKERGFICISTEHWFCCLSCLKTWWEHQSWKLDPKKAENATLIREISLKIKKD